MAAQDGTRALRLEHRRLLRGRRSSSARRGRRLTLDHLRVLIDTGIIFLDPQFGGEEADASTTADEGAKEGGGVGVARLAEMVERDAATQRRITALEKQNQQLIRQQEVLARLVGRTVATLEALIKMEEAVAREGEEEAEAGEEGVSRDLEGSGR